MDGLIITLDIFTTVIQDGQISDGTHEREKPDLPRCFPGSHEEMTLLTILFLLFLNFVQHLTCTNGCYSNCFFGEVCHFAFSFRNVRLL